MSVSPLRGRQEKYVAAKLRSGKEFLFMSSPHAASTNRTNMATSPRGHQLLEHPLLNEGSAFTEADRRRLGLLGLLPYHCSTLDEQLARVYGNYQRKSNDLERYIFLTAL